MRTACHCRPSCSAIRQSSHGAPVQKETYASFFSGSVSSLRFPLIGTLCCVTLCSVVQPVSQFFGVEVCFGTLVEVDEALGVSIRYGATILARLIYVLKEKQISIFFNIRKQGHTHVLSLVLCI